MALRWRPVNRNNTNKLDYAWNLHSESSSAEHTRRQALLQLVGLLGVLDDERVKVLRAADLELQRAVGLLLDGHVLRILPASGDQEVLDLKHLLRLRSKCTEVDVSF